MHAKVAQTALNYNNREGPTLQGSLKKSLEKSLRKLLNKCQEGHYSSKKITIFAWHLRGTIREGSWGQGVVHVLNYTRALG